MRYIRSQRVKKKPIQLFAAVYIPRGPLFQHLMKSHEI